MRIPWHVRLSAGDTSSPMGHVHWYQPTSFSQPKEQPPKAYRHSSTSETVNHFHFEIYLYVYIHTIKLMRSDGKIFKCEESQVARTFYYNSSSIFS